MIRSLIAIEKYIIVVEHDLSVLDYLSDFICCLYGKPGAYGVVTMPFGVREGINIFLAGFVPTENLRFREEAGGGASPYHHRCRLSSRHVYMVYWYTKPRGPSVSHNATFTLRAPTRMSFFYLSTNSK